MQGPNQLGNLRPDVHVSADDLTRVPEGVRTEAGLRHNIDVGVRYLEAWLRGQGCVPLYNLMEDAATAEISRTQLWQWIQHRAKLDDGRTITPELFLGALSEQADRLRRDLGEAYGKSMFDVAIAMFRDLTTSSTLEEFLTLPAYERLVEVNT